MRSARPAIASRLPRTARERRPRRSARCPPTGWAREATRPNRPPTACRNPRRVSPPPKARTNRCKTTFSTFWYSPVKKFAAETVRTFPVGIQRTRRVDSSTVARIGRGFINDRSSDENHEQIKIRGEIRWVPWNADRPEDEGEDRPHRRKFRRQDVADPAVRSRRVRRQLTPQGHHAWVED